MDDVVLGIVGDIGGCHTSRVTRRPVSSLELIGMGIIVLKQTNVVDARAHGRRGARESDNELGLTLGHRSRNGIFHIIEAVGITAFC